MSPHPPCPCRVTRAPAELAARFARRSGERARRPADPGSRSGHGRGRAGSSNGPPRFGRDDGHRRPSMAARRRLDAVGRVPSARCSIYGDDRARRPRRSSTTISMGDCGRPRSSTSPPSTATTACRRPTSTSSRAWFRRGADRKSLELYLETFAHTFGVMQEPDAIARVAAECAEDLAADGVVYAEVRMAPELCTEQRPHPRRGDRGHARGLPDRIDAGSRGRQPHRHEAARHRDAPGGPIGRGRRMRDPLARRRRRRLRRRRPGEGLSADPLPRCLRDDPAGELPHHDPRRRVVRAAVDLGGAPVRGRRAARARRPDRRRHHRPRRRLGRARPAGGVRPRPARAARDVPDARTSTPAPRRRSPSTRSTCSAGSASGSRSTPTTG